MTDITTDGLEKDADQAERTVTGRVHSAVSAALGALPVRLVDRNVGGDTVLTTGRTSERGGYSFGYRYPPAEPERQPAKPSPDLQIQVMHGDVVLASSHTQYNAGPEVVLDVNLPDDAPLPSEYEALVVTIGNHFDGDLAQLQETDTQQDITYLANKTGWDARAVAMASLAARFARPASTEPNADVAVALDRPAQPEAQAIAPAGIHPAFYYALFRAGVAAVPESLARTSPETVRKVWDDAIAQGVIAPSLSTQASAALDHLKQVAARDQLTAQPTVGPSTLAELLTVSLGDDRAKQQAFSMLCVEHAGDPDGLWAEVNERLGAETATRLQVDGQLAYLSMNNAKLIEALRARHEVTAPADLALQGYYSSDAWAQLVGDVEIPAQVPGDSTAERQANYAALLAAHVRLSFPTASIGHQVATGSLPVADAQRKPMADFLTSAHADFDIGSEPIARYLARTDTGLDAETVAQIIRLQRVYQITPDDKPMQALLADGLDSAYAVTRIGRQQFVRDYTGKLGDADVADMVYSRAQFVHSNVLHVTLSYLTARTNPAVGAADHEIIDPLADLADWLKNQHPTVTAQATLEELFGSLDYCSCDDCRSIIGPAAYLVDLLDYLDNKPASNQFTNPQEALLERRPDIEQLPLTCNNTNLALPYIDLVNETLEYYVANECSLAGYIGHDSDGTMSSADLTACPQYGDVVPTSTDAYNTLQATWFPAPLPFHRPLEQLRQHLGALGLDLVDVLTRLRNTDQLERGATTPANPAPYAWRDILAERLGLSRPEYRLLTDHTITLADVYGFAAGTSNGTVIDTLSSLREYSRRTGVSYDDLVSVLQTRFVNPDSVLIPLLQRLGVSFQDLHDLHTDALTDAAFRLKLPASLDETPFGGDAVAWVKKNYDNLVGLIVVAVGADPCDAGMMRIRHADPSSATGDLTATEFLRIQRFIRLCQKLGLSIDATDDLLASLCPVPASDSEADLDSALTTFLPRAGVAFLALDRLGLVAEDDLPGLLACWSAIDTTGDTSLYTRMFRSPTLLASGAADAAFAPDVTGAVLTENTVHLLDHEDALCAALSLTGAEFDLITGPAPLGLALTVNSPLDLATVSAIYRRGWLARALQISVFELLMLANVTGIDPFAKPDFAAAPPTEPALLRFTALVQAMAAAGLAPVQALYLLWNEDLSGTSAPADSVIAALARNVRAAAAAVAAQFVVTDDPKGQLTKNLMTLVLGAPTTDYFLGLLSGTVATSVPYASHTPDLAAAVLAAGGGRLGYDDFGKQLTFAGLLLPATMVALTAAAAGDADLLAALGDLGTAYAAATDPFFAAYTDPDLRVLAEAYVSSADPDDVRNDALLAGLVPGLAELRLQEQAVAAATAAAGCDPAFGPILLADAAVLPAADDATAAAVTDLIGVTVAGLSAAYFLGDDPTAAPDTQLDSLAVLGFDADNPPPAPTGGATSIAVTYIGYLCAPQDGHYNIAVTSDAGAAVAMSVGGASVAMAGGPRWTNQAPIALTTGALTPITITVTGVKTALDASWETSGAGWSAIPAGAMYSQVSIARLRTTYVRMLKAVALAGVLTVSPDELKYLAAVFAGHGFLAALAVDGKPSAATSVALADVLDALLGYARLKVAYAPTDTRLADTLASPTATGLQQLTGWDPVSLTALLQRFYGASDPAAVNDSLAMLRRLDDAFTVVTTSGVTADKLIAAATNDPSPTAVIAFRAAVRSRFAEADWLAAVKPVNDTLRTMQRDALVAYVLAKNGPQILADLGVAATDSRIATTDDLLNYFLMDVETEPIIETSRIRLALSSVQLFTERCLRNLEPIVAGSDIDGSQWTWRKRYRVWQANREVFLWPENWLDPSFRDDQSPIFQTTLAQLLQSDITDDTAAAAYLDYLSGLELVAKLEPCGIYYDDETDTAHVIASTAGQHRKYFYRRYTEGAWTPWEEIKLTIEDAPVVPYVWQGRLLLFWLQIHQASAVDPSDPGSALPSSGSGSSNKKLADMHMGEVTKRVSASAPDQIATQVSAVLCFSEYYNGKWQPMKTSDTDNPVKLDVWAPGTFPRSMLAIRPWPAKDADNDESLYVQITTSDTFPTENWVLCQKVLGDNFGWFYTAGFVLRSTHSAPSRFRDVDAVALIAPETIRRLLPTDEKRGTSLSAGYGSATTPGTYTDFPDAYHPIDILGSTLRQRTFEAQLGVSDQTEMPFLLSDARSVFYVTTDKIWHWYHEHVGFGIREIDGVIAKTHLKIPEVIVKPGPVDPSDPWEVTSVDAAQRVVSNAGDIRAALGTDSLVRFNGRDIGAGSSIALPELEAEGPA